MGEMVTSDTTQACTMSWPRDFYLNKELSCLVSFTLSFHILSVIISCLRLGEGDALFPLGLFNLHHCLKNTVDDQ